VYHRGEKVVDIWAGAADEAGTPWAHDTLAMSQSTTKGALAATVAMCVDRGQLDYDRPVATWWPEFAATGKDGILLRHVMCHEAGLFRIRHLIADAMEINDWDHMVHLIEGNAPVHAPGVANGYHGLTIAWLAGEPVRRAAGVSVGTFVRDEIAGPLGLDGLYIGVPDHELHRLAQPVAGGTTPTRSVTPQGLTAEGLPIDADGEFPLEWRVDNVADAILLPGFDHWFGRRESAQAEVPSVNGCFTARSLARLYAALANGGELDGVRLLSEETLARATAQQNDRPDLVLALPVCWRLGWHLAFTSEGIIPRGFAHFGFGGSGAWADPDNDLAFAYVTNTLTGGTALGDQRLPDLGGAVMRAADSRAPASRSTNH
jgi:CubicO group peptidase (beta-lactamase class C family)